MLPLQAVSFFGHLGDAGSRDPAIVKVEERAGGDGVVNRFVVPSGNTHLLNIVGRNGWQVAGNLRDVTEHGLVLLLESGGLEVVENASDKVLVDNGKNDIDLQARRGARHFRA